MRIYEVTKKHLPEEKQKGVDGKACWKGYKRMGTKKKGGKTVDNCVPIKKKQSKYQLTLHYICYILVE